MRTGITSVLVLVLAVTAGSVFGAERYVAPGGANVAPFASRETAATELQAAVDVAADGDVVRVLPGTYLIESEIVISNAVTVWGSGWSRTVVDGQDRECCFRLKHAGAVVRGFTITRGSREYGGGVCCEGGGTVQNCVIQANHAAVGGGGVYGGWVQNCLITGNSADGRGVGGGACNCILENCTVVGNAAGQGGGVAGGTALNTIIYYNDASLQGANWEGSAMSYSCTLPLPPGAGNMPDAPGFAEMGGAYPLDPDSPCVNSGSADVRFMYPKALDDHARVVGGRIDIGCSEYAPPPPPPDSDAMGAQRGAPGQVATAAAARPPESGLIPVGDRR